MKTPITIGEIARASNSLIKLEESFQAIRHYRQHGMPRGLTTGWRKLDEYFMFPPEGQLNLVTGTPGSGKSEWLDTLAVQAAVHHNYKVFIYSPENFPSEFHVQKLCEKFLGSPIVHNYNGHPKATQDDLETAFQFIRERFVIYNSMINITSVDGLIRTVQALIREHNIGMFIIDPWNKLDRKIPKGLDKLDFLGKCLVDLQIEVARAMSVQVFVVAHPTKPRQNKDGNYQKTTLYDVSGGAYFFDMIDNGFVCHRSWDDKLNSLEMDLTVGKVKNRFYAKVGELKFQFLPWCGRYDVL